ncbi:unnamed protein product (mitochondrion) [Plasmodiophora brassicae]|uniref:Ubiquitin-like domain-containing protein n=1 Tax=Plasmodiophora brassicae TaxID=37360 RepID=A0A3P3YIP3_PLABS|nr:unnamed protein product [Plasmodiophora brassicae]
MQLVLICGRQRHACELGAGTRVADVRRIASEAFGLDRGTLKLVGWANRSDSDEIPIRASGKPLKVNVIGSATHVVESVRQASEVQRVADEEAKRLEKFEEERRRLREVAEAERRAAETAALAERRAAEEAERQRRRAELEEQRRAQMLARQLELNGPLRRVLRCAEPIGEPCEPNIQFNRQAELPPEILEAAMDPERTTPLLPLFLVLRNEDRVYYVGVSEFSAAPGSIRLPPAAMKDLQVAVGQSLSLESISPVQGESVAIRPLDETFFWIEPSERAALLEFELRQRQLVVEGEILDLYYLGGLFQVVVETTRPGNPISIINTDLMDRALFLTFPSRRCRFATGDCDLYISSTTREPSPANFDVCFQAAGEASVTHEFVPGRRKDNRVCDGRDGEYREYVDVP